MSNGTPRGYSAEYLEALKRFKATLSWDMFADSVRGPPFVDKLFQAIRILPVNVGTESYNNLIGLL
jgi:hypothetical protein